MFKTIFENTVVIIMIINVRSGRPVIICKGNNPTRKDVPETTAPESVFKLSKVLSFIAFELISLSSLEVCSKLLPITAYPISGHPIVYQVSTVTSDFLSDVTDILQLLMSWSKNKINIIQLNRIDVSKIMYPIQRIDLYFVIAQKYLLPAIKEHKN